MPQTDLVKPFLRRLCFALVITSQRSCFAIIAKSNS